MCSFAAFTSLPNVEREGGRREPLAALPDLEAGLAVDQVPRGLRVTALDAVGEERLDVQAAHAGRSLEPAIGHDVPVARPPEPDGPARACEPCRPDLRAERLHAAAAVEPDH